MKGMIYNASSKLTELTMRMIVMDMLCDINAYLIKIDMMVMVNLGVAISK